MNPWNCLSESHVRISMILKKNRNTSHFKFHNIVRFEWKICCKKVPKESSKSFLSSLILGSEIQRCKLIGKIYAKEVYTSLLNELTQKSRVVDWIIIVNQGNIIFCKFYVTLMERLSHLPVWDSPISRF